VDVIPAAAGEPEREITTTETFGLGTFEATPAAILVGFGRRNA